MRLEYKLLSNRTGVLLTRSAGLVEKDLEVHFLGAPTGATAIFDFEDARSCYRALQEGTCTVPLSLLSGEIRVTVALFEGFVHTEKWICEELKTENSGLGGVIVAPNDQNLPLELVRLRLENEELNRKHAELLARMDEFDRWRESLMEGYDFT